ncbi:MAG: tetratricopeptide repeat protein [Deltaproteobacteria bacterium]|nr:tetratricopeptide repeat protein [Deltaproteobacteria bacterium]
MGCGGAFEAEPPTREAALGAAREALAGGRTEEAVEALRPLASAPEADAQIRLAYGRALIANQQQSLAIWPLERIASAPDAPPEARVLLIQALYAGGGLREAIREATVQLDFDPGDPAVRRLRADAHRANLQMEEALADYDLLIADQPGDPLLLQAKIDLLSEVERFDEARTAIDRQLELTQSGELAPEIAAQFCGAAVRFELEHGDPERARARSEDCLERHPRDPTVILAHVDVLDGLDRESDATEYLVAAGQQTLPRFRVQYALAKRLAERERLAEAEAVLRAAAKNVGGAQPLLALADIRVAHRDLPGAAQAVLEAIRNELGRGPGDADFDWKAIPPEALFAFGDVFLSAEDFDHAREIVAALDEDAYSLLLEARLALATGEPARALELYDRAFRLWPANSGARYLAGVAAMKQGEFDRAMGYYQDALRADPESNDAGIVLARMQMAQGYAGAAFDTLDVYLRKSPDHPQALRDFAAAAMAAGLPAYAESARARMATDVQWAGIALADQARDLARARGADEARKYLESSKGLFAPANYEALWAWAEALRALGRFDDAVARIEALRRAHPEESGPALAWARVLAAREDWDGARTVLEPLADREAGLLAAQVDLGKVLSALGRFDEAVERFDRAGRLDPLSAEAAYLACVALERSGKTKQALERLERLVMRHPWHAAALVEAARLRVAAGEPGGATPVLARQALRFLGSAPPEVIPELASVFTELGDAETAAGLRARVARNPG